MDMHNAFLQDDLINEMYIDIPQGFATQSGKHKVVRLYKSLYRLK